VKDIHAQRILVLDFGSQYTQLIARRLREIGIYSEIYPYDIEPQRIEAFAPGGIILSGGPESTLADDAPEIADVVFAANVPVLGICYGMQAMAIARCKSQTCNNKSAKHGGDNCNSVDESW